MGIFKKKDSSRMTRKEIKIAERHRDLIVKNQDIDGMLELTWDFIIALNEILTNRCDYDPDKLKNKAQKNLLLCMMVHNFSQSTVILSLFDNYNNTDEIVNALNEIGATRSAEIIKQVSDMIPKNGENFYDIADEKTQGLLDKIDDELSDSPDGNFHNLLRVYAEKHKKDLY